MKKSKHDHRLSGLNKWDQLKNRHELFDIDYVNKLTDTEKLMVIKL